jgi:hypothetical protein
MAGDCDKIIQRAPSAARPKHRVTLANIFAAGALATQSPFVFVQEKIVFGLDVELEVLVVQRKESGAVRIWGGNGGD